LEEVTSGRNDDADIGEEEHRLKPMLQACRLEAGATGGGCHCAGWQRVVASLASGNWGFGLGVRSEPEWWN
jgi:hypothetical protein